MRLLSTVAIINCIAIPAIAACPPCPGATGPCVVPDPTRPDKSYCEKGFDIRIKGGEVTIELKSPEVLKRLQKQIEDK